MKRLLTVLMTVLLLCNSVSTVKVVTAEEEGTTDVQEVHVHTEDCDHEHDHAHEETKDDLPQEEQELNEEDHELTEEETELPDEQIEEETELPVEEEYHALEVVYLAEEEQFRVNRYETIETDGELQVPTLIVYDFDDIDEDDGIHYAVAADAAVDGVLQIAAKIHSNSELEFSWYKLNETGEYEAVNDEDLSEDGRSLNVTVDTEYLNVEDLYRVEIMLKVEDQVYAVNVFFTIEAPEEIEEIRKEDGEIKEIFEEEIETLPELEGSEEEPDEAAAELENTAQDGAAASLTKAGLEYQIQENGEAYVTDYTGKTAKLTIPSSINGHKVTGINYGAFYENKTITSIKIPSSVTFIGNFAFEGCTKLKTVTLSSGLKSIGTNAFNGCAALVSIKLPDSVTSLGSDAFHGCSSLKEAVLSKGLTYIGTQTFIDCTSLASVSGYENATQIAGSAFQNTALTEFTIPDGTTTLFPNVFYYCSKLKKVKIPASLKEIRTRAFTCCYSLSQIYYEGSPDQWSQITGDIYDIENIPIVYGVYYNGGYMANEAFNLKKTPAEKGSNIQKISTNDYLEVQDIKTNEYGNYWGKVTSVNGTKVTKTAYVFMGHLQKHDHRRSLTNTHEHVDNVSHIKHTVCPTCNYRTSVTEKHDYSYQDDHICICGGWKPYTANGGYLVVKEGGIIAYSKAKTASSELMTLAKGTYVEVKGVALTSAKYYWGKVTLIDNEKPDKPMYIYMGGANLTPHKHTYSDMEIVYVDDDQHEIRDLCSECNYYRPAKEKHVQVNGFCAKCHQMVPIAKNKGDYVADYQIVLYKDKELKIFSGYVDGSTLIKVTSVKKNSAGQYYGVVSRYGTTDVKNLYVMMAEIYPHVTHDYVRDTYVTTDQKHALREKCSMIGCDHTRTNKGEYHTFNEYGVCMVCAQSKVFDQSGYYYVRRDVDADIWTNHTAKGKKAGSATKGTLIFIRKVEIAEDEDYWGNVAMYNGKTVNIKQPRYIRMSDLAKRINNMDYAISGSDANNHYLRFGTEYFPQEHHFDGNGVCAECGVHKDQAAQAFYIVKEDASAYIKTLGLFAATLLKDYKKDSVLTISGFEVGLGGTQFYGKVKAVDGVKETKAYYVPIEALQFHKEHDSSSVPVYLNDLQHSRAGCSICGQNNIIENHTFNADGICTVCGAKKAYDEGSVNKYFVLQSDVTLYSALNDAAAKGQTIPAGSIITFSKVDTNKNKNYRASGMKAYVPGQDPASYKGYMPTEADLLTPHDHTMSVRTICKHNEEYHFYGSACTKCGHEETEAGEYHVFRSGTCTKCGQKEIYNSRGDYLVAANTAQIKKGKSEKNVSKGTYIQIANVVEEKGILKGRVSMIDNEKLSGEWLIEMNTLEQHRHVFNNDLIGNRDDHHVYVESCTACKREIRTEEDHDFVNGFCKVCGHETVSRKIGVYKAKRHMIEYSTASSGAKKIADISNGTHMFISGVKTVDGLYWGKVDKAGKIAKAGWVRMSDLIEIERDASGLCSMDDPVYTYKDKYCHAVKISTTELTVSYTEDHHYNGDGVCIYCGYADVHSGVYYTDKADCTVYGDLMETNGKVIPFDLHTIEEAGTKVTISVGGVKHYTIYGESATFCQANIGNNTYWIRFSDLTDHIHVGRGSCKEIDDLTHAFYEHEGTNCLLCGHELPEKRVHVSTGSHVYNDKGVCEYCGSKEVNTEAGKYYAPYNGFYAYKHPWESSAPGTVYQKGDPINIEKIMLNDSVTVNGFRWGQVKGTKEYVLMRSLSTEPFSKSNVKPLTDDELIAWCRDRSGYNTLGTFSFADDVEIHKLDFSDILLTAVNERASGLVGQMFDIVKDALGYTKAREYYKNQVVGMLCEVEESFEDKGIYDEKEYFGKATNAIKSGIERYVKYNDDLLSDSSLTKNQKAAIKKTIDESNQVKKLLALGDLGLDFAALFSEDLSRNLDIIDAVREMRNYTGSDLDLKNAFDDVVTMYEDKYLNAVSIFVSDLLDTYFSDIVDFVLESTDSYTLDIVDEHAYNAVMLKFTDRYTKEYFTKYIERGHKGAKSLYAFANLALDTVMSLSSGKTRAAATRNFLLQVNVTYTASTAYEAAVERVKEGNTSKDALLNVRTQFALYRAALADLYDEMLDMESSHLFGIGEDNDLINYLQYEAEKIRNVELTNDPANYIQAITLEEFRNR